MKKILVSGSTAFDYNLSFSGRFKDQLLKGEDISSIFNMSLLVPELDKTYGGTALNVCYNLALLSEDPILITSVGGDFIFDGIIEEKVCLDYIHRENMIFSASAYIVSDEDGNQMTFFHPGAMNHGEKSHVSYVRENIEYAIVTPDKKEAIIQHVYDLYEKGVRIFFDPGQQITVFTKDELIPLFEMCQYLVVNQYEYRELMQKVEMDQAELVQKFEKIIVTYGAQGVQIIDTQETIHISAVNVDDVVDTTGAGDAFRAGLLKGLLLGKTWKVSAQLGSVLASYCIQHHGSQNHYFNAGVVMEDMKNIYNIEIDLYRKTL